MEDIIKKKERNSFDRSGNEDWEAECKFRGRRVKSMPSCAQPVEEYHQNERNAAKIRIVGEEGKGALSLMRRGRAKNGCSFEKEGGEGKSHS